MRGVCDLHGLRKELICFGPYGPACCGSCRVTRLCDRKLLCARKQLGDLVECRFLCGQPRVAAWIVRSR